MWKTMESRNGLTKRFTHFLILISIKKFITGKVNHFSSISMKTVVIVLLCAGTVFKCTIVQTQQPISQYKQKLMEVSIYFQ